VFDAVDLIKFILIGTRFCVIESSSDSIANRRTGSTHHTLSWG